MFRHLSVVVILAGSSYAEASTTSLHQRDAFRGMRTQARAAWPTLPTTPHPTYQMTPDTEVRLDGHPTDYRLIPAGARIEAMEVTPEGLILKVHFRTAVALPQVGNPR